MKKLKEETDERTVIAKEFNKFLNACHKKLNTKTSEDLAYIVYMTQGLSVSILKAENFSKHDILGIYSDVMGIEFPEEVSGESDLH